MPNNELSVPERDAQDIKISWSQIRTASECKQKAYLQRTTPRDPTQDIRIFFPGTVVDRALRDWLNDPDRKVGGMADAIERTMIREEETAKQTGDGLVKWKHAGDYKAVLETCQEAARKVEPYLEKLVLPYDFQPAMWFETSIEMTHLDGQPRDVILRGEMDIFLQDPATQKYEVWDLKITRDPNYWKKTVMQLAFYDLASFCKFGEWTSRAGLLQPLCDEPIIDFEITQQVRRDMLMRIQNYARARWAGDVAPKDDDAGCNFCGVRRMCTKMKKRKGDLMSPTSL